MDTWLSRFLLNLILDYPCAITIVGLKVSVASSRKAFVYKYPILVERENLVDIANIYNYQAFVETDKAGYIIRQWIASNLYDRIR